MRLRAAPDARPESGAGHLISPFTLLTCVHWQGVDHDHYERDEAEIVTEAAACIVLMGIGLDATAQSVEYVASWASIEPERALTLLERAEQAARGLETALGTRLEVQKAA